MLLAARNGPGDIERADKAAEPAAQAEPQLVVGSFARLSVALARHEWTKALVQMDEMHSRFGVALSERAMRATPMFKDLLETPEYAEWRAAHP